MRFSRRTDALTALAVQLEMLLKTHVFPASADFAIAPSSVSVRFDFGFAPEPDCWLMLSILSGRVRMIP